MIFLPIRIWREQCASAEMHELSRKSHVQFRCDKGWIFCIWDNSEPYLNLKTWQEVVPTVFLVSNRLQRRHAQHHCTVSVKLVVGCREPPVAITVTVDGGEVDHTPTLQLVHRLNPSATSTSGTIRRPRRFFQPKQQNATASTEPGNNGLGLRWRAAIVGAVVTVSVVEATAPDIVTVAGEKLHDAPEGNPEQLNDTAPPNAFCGVTKIVVVPLCPAVTVSDAGETATVKLGVATCVRLMV